MPLNFEDNNADDNNQVIRMEDKEFDSLFEGSGSTRTPGANDLKGTKQNIEKDEDDDQEDTDANDRKGKKGNTSKKKTESKAEEDNFEFLSLGDKDLDEELKKAGGKKHKELDDEEDEEEDDKKSDKNKDRKKQVRSEDDDNQGDEGDTDNDKKGDEEDDEEEDEDEETQKAPGKILKRTVDFMVEKGIWADFKGREELTEIDADTYAHLATQQDRYRVEKVLDEMIDETGPAGKAIINHIRNGGDPEEVIDIFKERKAIESIDIANEAGQRQVVTMQLESIGWKPEKIAKHIKRLEDDNELEDEAKEAQELLKKNNEKNLNEVNKRAALEKKQREDDDRAYMQSLENTLNKRTDLTKEERSLIKKNLLEYNVTLPGSTQKVNQFYLAFAKMQKDPNEYIDLVQFVLDKKKYLEKQGVVKKNKTVDEKFDFMKSSNKGTKTGTRSAEVTRRDSKKVTELDFGF